MLNLGVFLVAYLAAFVLLTRVPEENWSVGIQFMCALGAAAVIAVGILVPELQVIAFFLLGVLVRAATFNQRFFVKRDWIQEVLAMVAVLFFAAIITFLGNQALLNLRWVVIITVAAYAAKVVMVYLTYPGREIMVVDSLIVVLMSIVLASVMNLQLPQFLGASLRAVIIMIAAF